LKSGIICFGGSFDCTVRNFCGSGALLEFESTVGVPAAFELVIEAEQFRRQCRVVWVQKRRIGVAFNRRQSRSPAMTQGRPLVGLPFGLQAGQFDEI
jgi:hypothetical protein